MVRNNNCKAEKAQAFQNGKKVGFYLAKRYMTRRQLNQETRMGVENIAVKHNLATASVIRRTNKQGLIDLILGGPNRQKRML